MKKRNISLPLSGILKIVIPLMLLAGLSACGDSGMQVTTEFRSAQGVKKGTKVYFEERGVGQVLCSPVLGLIGNIIFSIDVLLSSSLAI